MSRKYESTSRRKMTWVLVIIIIAGFIGSLYWVGYSAWGSEVVAKYNGGYGTFDMKKYDVSTVQTVLEKMEPKGYTTYYGYFLGDMFFVLFYGGLQFIITLYVFKRIKKINKPGRIAFLVTVLFLLVRGIADVIENGLLFYTLWEYPHIHSLSIQVASIATRIKLGCIFLWTSMIILGIFSEFMVRCKEPVYRFVGRNYGKWKKHEEIQREES